MQVMSGSEGWAVRCVAENGIWMIRLNQRQLHGAHTAWAVQRKQKRLRRMCVAATGAPRGVSVAAKDEAARALDDSNRGALVIAPRVKVLALMSNSINGPFIVRKRQARRRPRALACFSSIVIYFFVWLVCSHILSRMTAVKDTT